MLCCRPLTEENSRCIRNTLDLRRPGSDTLMGKISVAIEWVQLLASVSAGSAQLLSGLSCTSQSETDTADLLDEEAVLVWHLGSLSIKVRLHQVIVLRLSDPRALLLVAMLTYNDLAASFAVPA